MTSNNNELRKERAYWIHHLGSLHPHGLNLEPWAYSITPPFFLTLDFHFPIAYFYYTVGIKKCFQFRSVPFRSVSVSFWNAVHLALAFRAVAFYSVTCCIIGVSRSLPFRLNLFGMQKRLCTLSSASLVCVLIGHRSHVLSNSDTAAPPFSG